jgi:hypothetical protein
MLASITPLGERGRNQQWPVTVAFYLLGSVAGGALLGALAGLLGWGLRSAVHRSTAASLVAVGAAAAAALAIDLRRRGSVPSVRRQVNEDWLRRYRSWVYGVGFGFQLGAGVITVVTSASTYLVVVVALFAPSVWLAVAITTAYGLARALPVLLTARVTTFPKLGALHQRLSAWLPGARRLTLATEFLVAVTAAGAALAAR